MTTSGLTQILDADAIDRAVGRLAQEILERHPRARQLALVGVRTRGVPLARRLAERLGQIERVDVPVGVLDITLYRDDSTAVGSQAVLRQSDIPFAVTGRRIVLVDDVLFTGRTVRAALDGIIDFGRPRLIQLAALIDRGHRELPIHADYVGKTISTGADQFVQVRLREEDGEDGVFVGAPPTSRRPAAAPRRAPAAAAAAVRPAARRAAKK